MNNSTHETEVKNDVELDLSQIKKPIPIPFSIIFSPLFIILSIIVFRLNFKIISTILAFFGIALLLIKLTISIIVNNTEVTKFSNNEKGVIDRLFNNLSKFQLLDNNIKMTTSNFINYTAAGYLSISKYFLKAGIDPNAIDENGNTAFLLVASKNEDFSSEAKRLLLVAGADPNVKDVTGEYLFISEIYNNDTDAISYFLENGVDVNQKSLDGQAAISIAINNSYVEATRLLLEYGVDPNYIDDKGECLLAAAIRINHTDIALVLLEAKSNPNVRALNGEHVLITSILHKNITIVEALLEAGINPNLESINNEFALDIAVTNELPEIVEALLEYGAKPDIVVYIDDSMKNDRIVFKALHKNNTDIINSLSNVCDLESIGLNDLSPLFYAVKQDKKDAVKVLLNHIEEKIINKGGIIVHKNDMPFSIEMYNSLEPINLSIALENLLRVNINEWLPMVQFILNDNIYLTNHLSGTLVGTIFDSVQFTPEERKKIQVEKLSIKSYQDYVENLVKNVSLAYGNGIKSERLWETESPTEISEVNCTNDECKKGNVICPECDGDKVEECKKCEGSGEITQKCHVCNGSGKNSCTCNEGVIHCDECGGHKYTKNIDCPCVFDHRFRVTCEECNGTGQDSKGDDCSTCRGYGHVCVLCNNSFELSIYENEDHCKCIKESHDHLLRKCNKCKGEGFIDNEICSACNGRGCICEKCNNEGIVVKDCRKCNKTGVVACPHCDHGYIKCKKCQGIGEYNVDCPDCDNGHVECSRCQGNGIINCSTCKGQGYLHEVTYYLFRYKSIKDSKENYHIIYDSENAKGLINMDNKAFIDLLKTFSNIETKRRIKHQIQDLTIDDFREQHIYEELSSFIKKVKHVPENLLIEVLDLIPVKYDILQFSGSNDTFYNILFINNKFLLKL